MMTPMLRMLLWLLLALLSCLHSADGEQQPLGYHVRSRNATLQDAKDIATIVIDAFEPLRSRRYLYQFRHEYPAEHRRCMEQGITRLLSRPSVYAQVVEAPPSPGNIALAAVAIWARNSTTQRADLHGMSGKCMHRDLNYTRAVAWERDFTAAKRRCIDERFGSAQLYLDTLATHPDYQRRGFASQLVSQGIDAGKRDSVDVTLIAEPTAATFYIHLGFVSVENITIDSVDHDEKFRFDVMKLDL